MTEKGVNLIELNLEDVISFFNHAQNKIYEYLKVDEDDTDKRYKLLGEATENLLKYIISLHQLRDYNGKFKNYLYDFAVLDELLASGIIDQKTFEDLKKFSEGEYEDYNLSMYAYLYKLIDILFYENTFDIIYETLKNQIALSLAEKKYLDKEDINIYDKFMLITNSFNKANLKELLDEDGKSVFKSLVTEVMSKKTGVQDRYRMFAGNLNNPKTDIFSYEIEDIAILIFILYKYCKYIHDNNDNFDFDYIENFYWDNVNKMKELINRSEEDINRIMAIERYKKDTLLASYLFQSSISVDDIEKYSKIEELNDKNLKFMFIKNVDLETYNRLRKQGFSIDEIIKIVNLNGNKYDNYNVDNKRMELLPYLSVEVINKLSEEESNYYLSKLHELKKLFDNKSYEEYFSAFVSLLQDEETKVYSELIKSVDFEQLKIYDNIDKYLRKNQKLKKNQIIENVVSNIKTFNENTDILGKLPILLDSLNNKEIYTALTDNGLKEDFIEHLDGTIFCYNNKYVLKVINILKEKGIDIFIEHKLNPNIIRYITQMIHKETSNQLAPMILYRPNNIVEENETI